MPVLYDEQGNPWRGAVDYVNNEAFSETRITATLLGVPNAEVVVPCNGVTTAAIQITGTFAGTLVVEGCTQAGNYIALPVRSSVTNQYVVNGITTIGTFVAPATGLATVRVRMSAWTSGAANVSVRTSRADALIQTEELPSTLGISATGVAGAAVTLTIPAPGAGLFQIIDYIEVVHTASALGTAAATPVVVTTTNLPGTPSLHCRADAFAQGTREVQRIGGCVPIKATTGNTTVTVVMPATPNVIWRANAFWRVGV